MTDLPKEINLIRVVIKELPDNSFEASYFVGDDFLMTVTFPDKDQYTEENSNIPQYFDKDLFYELCIRGVIPSMLEDYSRLTPDILRYIPEDSSLYPLLKRLSEETSKILMLEPCDCEHCTRMRDGNGPETPPSQLN